MDAKDLYNSVASQYETMLSSKEIDASILSHIKEVVFENDIQGGTVLDLGCGPGNLKDVLGDTFIYTGVDVAPAMLFLAKERGYQTIDGYIEDVLSTMSDNAYDYVVASSSLHFIKNIHAVLKDIERVAKQGYIISLDHMTDQYKQGFATVCTTPVYDYFGISIERSTTDITFLGWKSPRDKEGILVRLVYKKK